MGRLEKKEKKNGRLLLENGFMDERNSFRHHVINGIMCAAFKKENHPWKGEVAT